MCEVNNFKIDLDGIRDTFKLILKIKRSTN